MQLIDSYFDQESISASTSTSTSTSTSMRDLSPIDLAFQGDCEQALQKLDALGGASRVNYKHERALIYALNGNFDSVDDLKMEPLTIGFGWLVESPMQNLVYTWLKS